MTAQRIANSAGQPMPFRMGNQLPVKRGELPLERSLRVRMQNASLSGSGGGMGAGDRGSWQSIPDFTGNPYDSQDYVHRWRAYVHLYELSWEARKIVRIPVEDALRKPWEAQDIPEEMALPIHQSLDQMGFMSVLKRSLMLERLLGGCLTFLGLDSDLDNTEKIYHPHEGAKLRFCNAIPVSRISRVDWDNNPMSEHYMRPDMFMVNGERLHVSRALVWDGEPLFDPYDFALTNFRSNLSGFGPSKLAPIWDDIIKAVGTRQAAYQLIQTNNAILVAINDMQDLSSTAPGQANLNQLKDMANQLSIYKAAIIDGEKTTISQSAASFGSVPELILTFIQVLSAASDIPATRFLGQAPGGLNATGESDLENYYNVIDAYQHQRIAPALRRIYDIVGYQKFGQLWRKHRSKLTFKFPPLWNASELEEAQAATAHIDNVMKLHEAGLISPDKVIEELNAKGALSVTLDQDDLDNLDDMKEEQQINADEEIAKLKGQDSTGSKFGGQPTGIKQPPTEPEPNPPAKQPVPKQEVENSFGTEFLMGMKDEQEHLEEVGGDQHALAQIVMDHLKEDSQYYSKLRAAGLLKADTASNQLKDLKEIFSNKIDLPQLPVPSQAQIDSGNYQKHHIRVLGLDIAIENPRGSIRSGVSPEGKEWQVEMPAHYGYIKRTEGADGDHVDAYLGDHDESELVFVVDQLCLEDGSFDEHKCILGCTSEREALSLYKAGYSDGKGKDRIGSVKAMHLSDFKDWLQYGDLTQPFANKSEFDESAHKRADDGKFGSGGSSKTTKSDKPAKEAKQPKEAPAKVVHTPEDVAAHELARSRGLKVAPTWTNLQVSEDPNADLQVRCKDGKGNTQRIYSINHHTRKAAEKFARLKVFTQEYPQMLNKVKADVDKSEEAKALYLIMKTGFRVGGEKDTGAEHQAYGASTLLSGHVTVDGDTVSFDFTGKHGKNQAHTVKDATLAKIMSGKEGRMINTNEAKVLGYVKKMSGHDDFKVHDFRTYVATSTALALVKKTEAPKDMKSYNAAVKAICETVAQKLGNTAKMAKDSYIDPTVFMGWENDLKGATK